MTKKFPIVLGCILIFGLVGACKQDNSKSIAVDIADSLTVHVSKYSNGDLKSQNLFWKDTIPHGLHRKYYRNGQVKSEVPYKRGKKCCTARLYTKEGTLIQKDIYYSNSDSGLTKQFYNNGNLKAKSYYKGAHRHGPTYHYYKNGSIKGYQFYNSVVFDSAKLMYGVFYDGKGNIEKEGGRGFPVVNYNKKTLKIQDTFEIELQPINPPHSSERIVYAGLKDGKGEHFGDGNFITKKQLKIENNQVTFSKSWNEPDKFWVGARLFIKTDKKNAKKEFNTDMRVTVVDSSKTTPSK